MAEPKHDDCPKVTDIDLSRISAEEGLDGFNIVPVSDESIPPAFSVLDRDGMEVLTVALDERGGILITLPAIPGGEDRIISFVQQYFNQMDEDVNVNVNLMDRKTLIDSSSKAGILFTLITNRNNKVEMKVIIEDYRLKDIPNPIRHLVPIISEVKGIPQRAVEGAFSRAQEARRSIPGHI